MRLEAGLLWTGRMAEAPVVCGLLRRPHWSGDTRGRGRGLACSMPSPRPPLQEDAELGWDTPIPEGEPTEHPHSPSQEVQPILMVDAFWWVEWRAVVPGPQGFDPRESAPCCPVRALRPRPLTVEHMAIQRRHEAERVAACS